jgi:hypothetical protein
MPRFDFKRMLLVLTAGFLALAGAAAQGASRAPDTMPARPMFTVLPATAASYVQKQVSLPLWTLNWTYSGTGYSAQFVGTKPATNRTTTVPVFIIPVDIVITGVTTTTTFSPSTVQSNGQTALTNTLNSPIFSSGLDFTSGGADLGSTQYIDAYQRGDFWSKVSVNTAWHTLLGQPTVLPTQTLMPNAVQGRKGTQFGVKVALVTINYFDTQAQAILAAHPEITPGSLPIFVTYNTYLTQNAQCCIGGYHSATGAQTYSHFTYIGTPGAFAQDVSALSHEVGEWVLDPLTTNNSPCGIMENGDPLENEANYGDYPYTLGGFQYHLQDLVYVPYFGVRPTTSVGRQFTFQGTSLSVCQNGS